MNGKIVCLEYTEGMLCIVYLINYLSNVTPFYVRSPFIARYKIVFMTHWSPEKYLYYLSNGE